MNFTIKGDIPFSEVVEILKKQLCEKINKMDKMDKMEFKELSKIPYFDNNNYVWEFDLELISVDKLNDFQEKMNDYIKLQNLIKKGF